MRSKQEVREAIEIISKALKEDTAYYEIWKANLENCIEKEYVNSELEGYTDINEIAQKAAKRFLKLLTSAK